jgi:hypothetical protein
MKSIKTKWGGIEYRNERGELHREDGPAYLNPLTGTKAWVINGKCHREDGPAVVFFDGTEWYYLNDILYYEEEYEQEILKLKLMRLKDL